MDLQRVHERNWGPAGSRSPVGRIASCLPNTTALYFGGRRRLVRVWPSCGCYWPARWIERGPRRLRESLW